MEIQELADVILWDADYGDGELLYLSSAYRTTL